ncbi:MAG: hypothetical protein N3F07_03460 [Candidatus Micrarchaeota archaeon]|nr:hypothetical protein [Candidatus Micrarchaeota archaeon]
MLSSELVVAFVLFMASLFFFLLAWNSIFSSYASQLQQHQLHFALMSISNQLLLSSGDPADWEFSALQNANAFGLANPDGTLSAAKLSALQSLNSTHYDAVRERMGAGRLEVYVEVTDAENRAVLYRFGRQADGPQASQASAYIQRLALMDGNLVLLKTQVWEAQR